MKRPFIISGIIGVCVIITSIILIMVFPAKVHKLPEGFITPIIAFEFIRTPQEVFDLFGPAESPQHQTLINAMDLGNKLDFIYMLLYNAFLVVFCWKVASLTGKKIYLAGVFVALVILASDCFENIQLLAITSHLGNSSFESQLKMLKIFTWLKWEGTVVAFLILLPYFLKGAVLSRMIAPCSAIAAVLSVTAFTHHGVANELFSLSVVIVFVLMIVYSLFHKEAIATTGS